MPLHRRARFFEGIDEAQIAGYFFFDPATAWHGNQKCKEHNQSHDEFFGQAKVPFPAFPRPMIYRQSL